MNKDIDNSRDIIDSREVLERIEELKGIEERDEAENDELKALTALQDEAEGYCPDWKFGAALIRESYFTEYTMDMLADIGDLPRDIPHYIAIDEEQTAENIKVDYTEVNFDGVTYLVR